MKNTRRFFFGTLREEPSGATSIRLTFNSIDIAEWLDNSPSAIRTYRNELRKRLKQVFPEAKVVMKGIPTADGNTWMISNTADEVDVLMQCEDILDQVVNSKNDWLPQ